MPRSRETIFLFFSILPPPPFRRENSLDRETTVPPTNLPTSTPLPLFAVRIVWTARPLSLLLTSLLQPPTPTTHEVCQYGNTYLTSAGHRTEVEELPCSRKMARSTGVSAFDTVMANFIAKLWKIVDNPEYTALVSWTNVSSAV